MHPDYLTKPLWQLLFLYGHEWVAQQQKIFKGIYDNKL